MALSYRYSAFISYSHYDRKAAQWLHRALEAYRFPPRLRGRDSALGPLGTRLPPVFRDRDELPASSDLATSVRKALAEAHSLIVVCSARGARSQWVNAEIRAFAALGGRDRVQCLIVAGHPNASRLPDVDSALECLPPALFENGGEEPLAADIRPGHDGRRSARLKLIAGIIGVGYDELRNREQQRRHRRMAMIASASGVGFAFMTGLAGYALVARAEAIRERDIAREKTLTAERTTDFVQSLFEVSDPSEAKGAKVTAKEVLDRGAARISHSLDREPNVKAQLMTTLSKVYQGLGLYHKGDALVRQSMALPVTDEDVRARQFMALASAEYRRGDYRRAVAGYATALDHARRLTDRAPTLEAAILAAMGDAKARAGGMLGARGDIQRALAIDLSHSGPRDVSVARDLEALGYDYLSNENYVKSRELFDRALAIRIPLESMNHPQVSEDLNELGSIAYLQHDTKAAEHYFRLALQADEMVLGSNHPDVAITANNLARVLLERGEFDQAEPILRHAVAITEAQRDPDNDYFAFLYDNLGIAKWQLGRESEAETLFRKGLAIAQAHHHRNRAPIMTDLAGLLCQKGEATQGLALLQQARPIMRQDYPDDPWRWSWVDNTRGDCLSRSGKREQAARVLSASMPELKKRWPRQTFYRELAVQRLDKARQ